MTTLTATKQKSNNIEGYFFTFSLPSDWQTCLNEFKDAGEYGGKGSDSFHYVNQPVKGWFAANDKAQKIKTWAEKTDWFDEIEWNEDDMANQSVWEEAADKVKWDASTSSKSTWQNVGKKTQEKADQDTGYQYGFFNDFSFQDAKQEHDNFKDKKKNDEPKASADGFMDDFVTLEVTLEMEFLNLILGSGASIAMKLDVLKSAYRAAAKHLHTDKTGGTNHDAIAELNVKYKQLTDQLERQQ